MRGLVLLLVVIVLLVAALKVSGVKLEIDASCYASVESGCIPGKPYRAVDDK